MGRDEHGRVGAQEHSLAGMGHGISGRFAVDFFCWDPAPDFRLQYYDFAQMACAGPPQKLRRHVRIAIERDPQINPTT